MDFSKITPKNILHYFQGHIKWLGDEFNLLPRHTKEQILWRSQQCKNDCVPEGQCKWCGCSLPGKFYVTESCNFGERFPNLMTHDEWEKFKQEKGIKPIMNL